MSKYTAVPNVPDVRTAKEAESKICIKLGWKQRQMKRSSGLGIGSWKESKKKCQLSQEGVLVCVRMFKRFNTTNKRWFKTSNFQPNWIKFGFFLDVDRAHLPRDEESDLAKKVRDAMEAKHDLEIVSRTFMHRHHFVDRWNYSCCEKTRFQFHWKKLILSRTPEQIWTWCKRRKWFLAKRNSLDPRMDSQDLPYWKNLQDRWTQGRLTQIQATSRPDDFWSEI